MRVNDILLNTELADVAKLFFGDDVPNIKMDIQGRSFCVYVGGRKYEFTYTDDIYSHIPSEHATARLSKIALYDALCAHTGRKMPWGALTGVRPSKLFYELLRGGNSATRATDLMCEIYRVSEARSCILRRIEYAQRGKVFFPDNYVNLYVHIPYCTTRCSYCSFVSSPISKCIEQSHEYTRMLCDEIKRSKELLDSKGLNILSVYIGGGTPTALCPDDLCTVLDAIGNMSVEYTCEAGRPDTIDKQKADIIREHGIGRVCVNPQTLCEKTLDKIGRRHTVDDFYKAYDIIRSRGFSINCDLIAGLADEGVQDFASSFEGVKALAPDNITVHCLSKKNGSGIRYDSAQNDASSDMIEYALSHIGAYRPYYLYRQKRQAGNLENIGFSLPGKECVNNITTMEETVTVMACGAGAISKAVKNGNIARFANMRDVPLYLSRYKEKLDAKLSFFNELF